MLSQLDTTRPMQRKQSESGGGGRGQFVIVSMVDNCGWWSMLLGDIPIDNNQHHHCKVFQYSSHTNFNVLLTLVILLFNTITSTYSISTTDATGNKIINQNHGIHVDWWKIKPLIASNVTDLIVNIGENVLLECDNHSYDLGINIDNIEHNDKDMIQKYRHHRQHSASNDDSNNNNFHNSRKTYNSVKKNSIFQYIWCRHEEQANNFDNLSITSSVDDDVNQEDHRPKPPATNYNVDHVRNGTNHKKIKSILQYKTCFEGDRYFVANENHVSTVIYRCDMRYRPSAKHQLPHTNVNNDQYSDDQLVVRRKIFKLYVDQFPKAYRKREIRDLAKTGWPEKSGRPVPCRAPRCKPYATVKEARCSRIELNIRYPNSQYGYNQSIDHWGTITCNDQIGGFQLWLIGYGIVKKFLPTERIVLENLVPGKRYCFNGWAYNACGAGPVFTLEGVCAKNTEECQSNSDEHCELDVDYSY